MSHGFRGGGVICRDLVANSRLTQRPVWLDAKLTNPSEEVRICQSTLAQSSAKGRALLFEPEKVADSEDAVMSDVDANANAKADI